MKTTLAVLLLLVLLSSPALAQRYSLGVSSCGGVVYPIANDSPDPLQWLGSFDDCLSPAMGTNLFGQVGPGLLRAWAESYDHNDGLDHLGSGNGGVGLNMGFDTLYFEGPAGTVETAIRVDVHAFLAVESPSGDSRATVQIDIAVAHQHYFFGSVQIQDGSAPDPPNAGGLFAGMLSEVEGGWEIDGIVTTPSFSVPTNSTLTLEVSLQVSAQAYNPALLGRAETTIDLGHTVRFPLDQPTFDLPDGYSAQCPEAGIVDNQWQGGVRVDTRSWGGLKARY